MPRCQNKSNSFSTDSFWHRDKKELEIAPNFFENFQLVLILLSHLLLRKLPNNSKTR